MPFGEAFVLKFLNDALNAPFKVRMDLLPLFARMGVFGLEHDFLAQQEDETPSLSEAQRQLLEMTRHAIAELDALNEDPDIPFKK